jgi:hypothetical protein
MRNLVHINKPDTKNSEVNSTENHTVLKSAPEPEAPESNALVPTIDLYKAKVLFNLTQKMVENTVDRRISLLEKKIKKRDKEIMQSIRRIQSQMVMQRKTRQQPWWLRLFQRDKR